MELSLDADKRELAERVAEFARREFPHEGGIEETDGFDRDVARTLADTGFVGIDFPESEGGQGGDLMDAIVVMREVSRVAPHAGDVVQAFNFGGIRQLLTLGGPAVKERWLRPALRGEALVSVAMTEPGAGSGLADLSTKAELVGDEVVLNGSKVFATHGLDADVLVVWARFGAGADGIGAVAVPTDAPGFSRGSPARFLSGERYCTMYFDDCRVAADHVLVDSRALTTMMPVFNVERLGNTTRSLALATAAFQAAVEHARVRESAGRRLADLQGLQWKFADMRMRLDAAELLLHRAATSTSGPGRSVSPDLTAIAKCYGNEAAFFVANEALQIFGAYGYSREYPIEYYFRRIRGWMIAGGSVEVLRNRIAKSVLAVPGGRREGAA